MENLNFGFVSDFEIQASDLILLGLGDVAEARTASCELIINRRAEE